MIFCTASDEKEAEKIAKALLEEGLIGCTNIFPVRSIYRWKENVEDEKEFAMLMKTRDSKVKKVIKRIKELHSYDVPEVISFRIEKGSKDYLDWIGEETK